MIWHKFHARRTEIDGISFSSQKEAKYYGQLILAQKAGDLLFFLRQAPFHIPGIQNGKPSQVRYVVDFVEFWKNGEVRFVDIKGFKTAEFIAKKKIIQAMYPVEILEV